MSIVMGKSIPSRSCLESSNQVAVAVADAFSKNISNFMIHGKEDTKNGPLRNNAIYKLSIL